LNVKDFVRGVQRKTDGEGTKNLTIELEDALKQSRRVSQIRSLTIAGRPIHGFINDDCFQVTHACAPEWNMQISEHEFVDLPAILISEDDEWVNLQAGEFLT